MTKSQNDVPTMTNGGETLSSGKESASPEFLQSLDADVASCGCSTQFTAFYDIAKKEFLIRNDYGWIPQTEAQFKRRLKKIGVSTKTLEGMFISPADNEILRIQDHKSVNYAAPLAGYSEGLRDEDGRRYLVTQGPQLITPLEGQWETLRSTFEAVLKESDHDQLLYFYGWLSCAVKSLRAENFQSGQALVMAGPIGCGKSLIQNLITKTLGGRVAKPYQYMTGATAFNSDLFGAEHLMIEDEAPSTDFRSRRNLGTYIKQITVNQEQRLHAKGRDAIMLAPYWRLSITLNDEPEDLHVLPPMDSSLEDKLILLRAYKRTLPMPTNNPTEKKLFWDTLIGEMPAFLHWLIEEYEIPAHLKSERFGITHFHHPVLLESLDETSNEALLLSLIDQYISLPFKGTATALEGSLRNAAGRSVDKLFGFNNACGTYLSRLNKKFPDRVKRHRTKHENQWVISLQTDLDPSTPSTGELL